MPHVTCKQRLQVHIYLPMLMGLKHCLLKRLRQGDPDRVQSQTAQLRSSLKNSRAVETAMQTHLAKHPHKNAVMVAHWAVHAHVCTHKNRQKVKDISVVEALPNTCEVPVVQTPRPQKLETSYRQLYQLSVKSKYIL